MTRSRSIFMTLPMHGCDDDAWLSLGTLTLNEGVFGRHARFLEMQHGAKPREEFSLGWEELPDCGYLQASNSEIVVSTTKLDSVMWRSAKKMCME